MLIKHRDKQHLSFKIALHTSFIFSLLAGILIGYLFITIYQENSSKNETAIQRSNQVLDELNLLVLQNKELIDKQIGLEQEVSQLKTTYTASKLVNDNINTYELLLGEKNVTGPGITIDIDIDLAQYWFIDIVNDLYDFEAEAIIINDIFITPKTFFLEDSTTHQIYIGNYPIYSPFNIKVIGNPNILYKGLTATTGILEKMKQNFPNKEDNIKIETKNSVILKTTLQHKIMS